MAYKIISVSYGHGKRGGDGKLSPSGKLYDYTTDKEYRTGDVVVVPVQHYKKKSVIYNTLAVVQLTRNIEGSAGQNVKNYLEGNRDKRGRFKVRVKLKDTAQKLEAAKQQGLDVETESEVNVTTLPGYETRGKNEKWSEPLPKDTNVRDSRRYISRG